MQLFVDVTKDRMIQVAATELAMVTLTLAQDMPKGDARRTRLQRAEKMFLDLRRVSGGDPHQELRLGQVYFWLGKKTEGQKVPMRITLKDESPLLSQDCGRFGSPPRTSGSGPAPSSLRHPMTW